MVSIRETLYYVYTKMQESHLFYVVDDFLYFLKAYTGYFIFSVQQKLSLLKGTSLILDG